MSRVQIELTDANRERLESLARSTGKSWDELVNDAVRQLIAEAEEDEQKRFLAWREALLGIEGMWKDRTDLPDFAELRKSWDRNPWGR
ncbi:MAG TPA: hypothetical protein VK324_08600 [Tepidisphaeraceae bacterium]|nr:hypothetical protein [Tepidisphaeraceae bacterium]